MSVADRVRRTVLKHGLFERGSRVAVALSGGADSVALLHVLRDLETAGDLVLAGVAHFNHRLRGGEADADEAFCRELAERFGLPVEIGSDDVRAAAAEQRRSIEDAARALRYAFLEEARARLSADVVAVAHTVEDQAETFLLRLIRGAGPRGLAGIHPRAGRIVRPLLEVRRDELRGLLGERDQPFREDASNADLAIPRNRIRHELIPYLERQFSPSIVQVLAREAAIAREDEARLAQEAIEVAGLIVLRETDLAGGCRVSVDPVALTSLPAALASRVARLALEAGAPGHFTGSEQIERFLEFAGSGRPGAALSLPGQQALSRDGRVELGAAPPRRAPAPGANSFSFPLSIPGEVVLALQGWVVSAAQVEAAPESSDAGELVAGVLASSVQLPLAVRSRAPGDRVLVSGMGGRHKKLQDLFVDRKVPRQLRDSVPLVVDAGGQIVWVVGQPVADAFRPGGASTGVILLKARRLTFDSGGSGAPARGTR